ncbi:hypothetical protein FFLO_05175 [Filobasidium floriforme]|uniref:Glycoside hydrolase family 5 domain-containing protein n=1 Tax=Filobasidium floriforme TaxID=5210 RepID=A0A8K0JMW2_9TREE|nr:hypothetical protein FFLO_05175 [Filobasidium floriforme]
MFEGKPDWVIDELTYGAYWRSTNYTRGFKEVEGHWDSWIVRKDFEDIKRLGLNTVRIPIGFWSIIPLGPDEPFMTGAFEYLQRAVVWCRDIGLAVMIDLHGVPSGQNGFDNSGSTNSRSWFTNTTSIQRTLSAITILAQEFTASSYGGTVVAIELVNEPFPYGDNEVQALRTFYEDGYGLIRGVDGRVAVVISDAFRGLREWEGFMPSNRFNRVVLDTHIYSMFTIELVEQGYTDKLRTFCDKLPELVQSNQNIWTVVGEFTTASTDCAAYLNGRGKGARWDSTTDPSPTNLTGNCRGKTGSGADFSNEYTDYLARSFETQTWIYEQASGWIYWCWKTESASEWAFQDGVTYGWVPQPLWDRPATLGQPCQFNDSAQSIENGSPPFTTPDTFRHLPFLLLITMFLTLYL